jgi:hypothetical protein
MGQKSNLLTLKKSNNYLDILSYNSKNGIQILLFLKNFEFLLKKKNVWISKKSLNFSGNCCYFNLVLFYCSRKISFFRRKGLVLKQKKNFTLSLKKKSLNKMFNVFNKLRQNLFCISTINSNKLINKEISLFIYLKTKRFVNLIFARRFNLFIDFIKITSLFLENKVSSSFYLHLLSQIFKSLSKKLHNRFIFFLKYIFHLLIIDINNEKKKIVSNIKGIKFIINGKLSGKPRASSYCIQEGSIPNQSIDKNIVFAKQHTYTLLGAFGLKIWVHRN